MRPHDLAIFSRAGLEHAFAGLLFTAALALVAGGALTMALHAALAA